MQHQRSFRKDARAIFDAAIRAVQPGPAIRRSLRVEGDRLFVSTSNGNEGFSFDLNRFSRVLLVGCGKASVQMAEAITELLGERIQGGVVVTKYGHAQGATRIGSVEIIEAGHPVPDQAGFEGAKRAMRVLEKADPHTLVIAPISGGGSALWPLPVDGISLEELRVTNELLVASGASIDEINCIRKHLSAIKGGKGAQAAFPAHVLALAISDVIDDNLSTIASGPFAADETTFKNSSQIIEKYSLTDLLPARVLGFLTRGANSSSFETPKAGDPIFERCRSIICARNDLALQEASRCAQDLGYQPFIISSSLAGDLHEVSGILSGRIHSETQNNDRPICILSGGEPTVRLPKNHGKGGRNQQLALLVANKISGRHPIGFLSGGTDGTDGPTDAAGGFVDNTTVETAEKVGISIDDHIRRFDCYGALRKLGGLVVTGPTGTNVMDIHIGLISK